MISSGIEGCNKGKHMKGRRGMKKEEGEKGEGNMVRMIKSNKVCEKGKRTKGRRGMKKEKEKKMLRMIKRYKKGARR